MAYHKSKEEQRAEQIIPFVGVGLATAASLGMLAVVEHKPSHNHPHQDTPIEKHGDHHGSAGMPSDEHLKQFTHEHGIEIHSIPDVVATQKNHGPVKVTTIESNK